MGNHQIRRDNWSFGIFLSPASQATEAKALQVGGVLQSSMISQKLKSCILQSHCTKIFIMGMWDIKYYISKHSSPIGMKSDHDFQS